jgi:hypothetical protein
MLAPRSLVLSIIASTATVGLLFVGAPPIAAAAVSPDAAAAPAAGQAGYASPSESGATPNAAGPSACVQVADYPHASSHVPGTMDGAIRTVCANAVPEIKYTAQLWQTRWWGWDRIGSVGHANVFNVKLAKAISSHTCENTTIRTTGNGYVIDVDGRAYYASTTSISVKNPCQ